MVVARLNSPLSVRQEPAECTSRTCQGAVGAIKVMDLVERFMSKPRKWLSPTFPVQWVVRKSRGVPVQHHT